MTTKRSDTMTRVVSNYARLMVTFVSGLLIVRLLAEIGPSTLNIYLVVLSGTGFAFFLKIVMQESVVPLLGLSFDGVGDRDFASTYWISFLFAFFASIFATAVFLLLWALQSSFDTGNLPASIFGIALASGAVRTVVSAFATPPLQAILVAGRTLAYNLFLSFERLVDLIAVGLIVTLAAGIVEPKAAAWYFVGSTILYVTVQLSVFVYARRIDRRFVPRRVPVRLADLKLARGIFGWNIAIVVAFLLYLRYSTLAVNVAIGETATLLLGLVFLLIGYQRQVSMGLVIGLDAVVARSFGSGRPQAGQDAFVLKTVLRSTHVQSIFSCGSVALLFVLADPIFRLWLGASLAESGWDAEVATNVFRIMSLGVLARSISESWMKILNGQGRVGYYAPWLLAGGICYATLLTIWLNAGVPMQGIFLRSAVAFSTLYVFVHGVVIPELLCRSLGLPRWSLWQEVLGPVVAIIPASLIASFALGPWVSSAIVLLTLFLLGFRFALSLREGS